MEGGSLSEAPATPKAPCLYQRLWFNLTSQFTLRAGETVSEGRGSRKKEILVGVILYPGYVVEE